MTANPPSFASSPYAPIRRNSYLRRSSSSTSSTSWSRAGGGRNDTSGGGNGRGSAAAMGLFLFVVRFWKDVYTHHRHVWESLRNPRELWARLTGTTTLWKSIPYTNQQQEEDGSIGAIPNTHESHCSVQGTKIIASSQLNEGTTSNERMQWNLHAIQRVLQYWFGQYPPETSQKMLWMIAASSVEHRQRVDADIANKFEPLLLELSATTPSPSRWDDWCHDPDGVYGARGKIAAIIVLDQFSRHIVRHYETVIAKEGGRKRNNTPSSLALTVTMEALDRRALETAQLFVQRHADEIKCGCSLIPLPMYIFALMPFRHANTMESVQYVQACVEEVAKQQTQVDAMLGRFRKATNRRLAVLQDEARRTGGATSTATASTAGDVTVNGSHETRELKCGEFTDDDILETYPFHADLTPSQYHPVHKTIGAFLMEQGIHPISSLRENEQRAEQLSPSASIIVSLSGGVDSMVIASVLAHLKTSCGYPHLNVIAVHIDYANRPESDAEADFVRRYCEETLQIQFFCRRIDEVTRGVTARDDYECIAREIRYESYRDAVAVAKKNMGLADSLTPVIGVMLGHHKGDLRENVLSNAHKGCGPLDLSGMTAVSKNNGIILYRPLLPVEKSSILDYAHKFGIPYFKDTTPHWSTRGKLRNKLLPLLEEIYGDGSMNNLSRLAVESDECRALLQKSSIGPFMDSIVRTPMGIILDTTPWKDQALYFWKFVLREALHSASLGMFSDKSVESFLERVRAKKVKNAWLQCRKDYGVYLQEDGKVFIFYPASFPWKKEDAYSTVGEVEFGTDKLVGPWRIRSEVMTIEPLDRQTYLEKKALTSMDSLMEGKIEYFLEAPMMFDNDSSRFVPRTLIFRKFTKADRPQAWKQCDLRVQSTLPILGNDEIANTGMKEITEIGFASDGSEGSSKPRSTCLIRTSIELQQLESWTSGHHAEPAALASTIKI